MKPGLEGKGRKEILQTFLPWIIAVAMFTVFLAGRSFQPEFFGVNQYRNLPVMVLVTLLFIGIVPLLLFGIKSAELIPKVRSIASGKYFGLIFSVLFAALCTILFFELSTTFLNFDGEQFEAKFRRDYEAGSIHLVHDEMLELYFHFKFWVYAWKNWDLSVADSYRFLSCISGGVFVFMLGMFAWDAFRERMLAFLPIALSSGGILLFFGDVENYTMTSVFILGFLWFGWRSLQKWGRWDLVIASAFLGIAISFHLLAGWLIPALLFLIWMRLRTEKLSGLVALLPVVLIPLIVVLFLDSQGLPLSDLFENSNVFGHGDGVLSMLVSPEYNYYYWLGHLIILLFPMLASFIGLAVVGGIEWTAEIKFLVVAGCMMFLFMISWNAAIGIYHDWSLFANSGIVLSILAGFAFMRAKSIPNKWVLYPFIITPVLIHTIAWIWYNHSDGTVPELIGM